jgi:hypothetical protein
MSDTGIFSRSRAEGCQQHCVRSEVELEKPDVPLEERLMDIGEGVVVVIRGSTETHWSD